MKFSYLFVFYSFNVLCVGFNMLRVKKNNVVFIRWKKESFPTHSGLSEWNITGLFGKLCLKNFMYNVRKHRYVFCNTISSKSCRFDTNTGYKAEQITCYSDYATGSKADKCLGVIIPLCLSNLYRLQASKNKTLRISGTHYIYYNMFRLTYTAIFR